MRVLLCLLMLWSSSLLAQVIPINPLGPNFQFSDGYVFPNRSVLLATNEPFLVKVPRLDSAAFREGRFSVIYTDSFKVRELSILDQQVFASGPYLTRDGGQTWEYGHRADDQQYIFLESGQWAVIDVNGDLSLSQDSGRSWQSTGARQVTPLNRSDSSFFFASKVDTSLWRLDPDSFYYFDDWQRILPQMNEISFFKQIDSLRYIFEAGRRVYIYNTALDSSYLSAFPGFNNNYTRFRSDGQRIYREDPLGQIWVQSKTNPQWGQLDPLTFIPSFGYGNGFFLYNNHGQGQRVGEGNLSVFKALGRVKELFGFNRHPNTGAVYHLVGSKEVLAPRVNPGSPELGRRFNFNGDSLGIMRRRFNDIYPTYDSGYAFAILGDSVFYSTDTGRSWQNAGKYRDLFSLQWSSFYTDRISFQGVKDQQIYASFFLDGIIRDSLSLRQVDLVTGQIRRKGLVLPFNYDATYLRSGQKVLFRNADTGAFILYDKLWSTGSGLAGAQPVNVLTNGDWPIGLAFDGQEYVLSTTGSLYRSVDLVQWTEDSTAHFPHPIDVALRPGVYFHLKKHHLYWTADHGRGGVQQTLLAMSPLDNMTKLDSNSLMLGGSGGQLYLIKVPSDGTVNLKEEQTAPQLYFFPNPTKNQINLRWSAGGKGRLRIYDQQGRLKLQQELAGASSHRLDIGHWSSGLYIIEWQQEGQLKRVRIIKAP